MYSVVQNYEITKEKYDELVKLRDTSTREFFKEIEKISDNSSYPPNAYGFQLPIKVFEEHGKYYASWVRWSSCD